MRKLTKGLIVTALLFSWGGTALTAAFAANLRDTLTAFRQKNLRENLNLRARLAQVESAVEAGADKLLGAGTEPDGNAVQADAPAQATPAESTSGRLPAGTDGVGEVTHAGAHAAEEPVGTQPAEACAYRVTEYRGIIGVFDGDGRLMRTVNVPGGHTACRGSGGTCRRDSRQDLAGNDGHRGAVCVTARQNGAAGLLRRRRFPSGRAF